MLLLIFAYKEDLLIRHYNERKNYGVLQIYLSDNKFLLDYYKIEFKLLNKLYHPNTRGK